MGVGVTKAPEIEEFSYDSPAPHRESVTIERHMHTPTDTSV